MTDETKQDVARILNAVLEDRELSEIMYRRRMHNGAPMLNEYREAVRIAVDAIGEVLDWRDLAEEVAKRRRK